MDSFTERMLNPEVITIPFRCDCGTTWVRNFPKDTKWSGQTIPQTCDSCAAKEPPDED